MTITTADNSTGFKRCAVCKIDLKGRFVYVDDEVEDLLGRTKEELFGKSFIDFLHRKSRNKIKQLISMRNHYETFYDTTVVTILGREQEPITTNIVVNLNFIAGNPVNYQIIINPREYSSTTSLQPTGDQDQVYSQFLMDMLEIEGLTDMKKFACLVRGFTGAGQAAVYKTGGDDLEPRAATADENSADFTFKSIPECGQLHRDVAISGEAYSCVDQEDAQRAIETYGSAPAEFVARFAPEDDDGAYLLRLVFAEEGDAERIAEAVQRAELALTLFQRLFGNRKADAFEDDSSLDVKFTIGFLDSLGIGAILTDRSGTVTGYNQTLVRQLADENLEGDYRLVVEKLRPENPNTLLDEIIDSLQVPPDESESEDFRTRVNLPGGEGADLVVVRFSLDPTDLSSCLVFIPSTGGSEIDTGRPGARKLPLAEILQSIKSVILSINGFSGSLAHKFFSKLGDDGNDSLRCMDENSRALTSMINDLSRLVELLESEDRAELVDLNLAVSHALQDVLCSFPETKVKCQYKNLPKVIASRQLLVTVLSNLISNSIKFNRKSHIIISIKAHVKNQECLLSIADNGPGIPNIYLPRVFDFFYSVPGLASMPYPGNGSGLAICRLLVQKIGGSIDIESAEGKGTTVSIVLPMPESVRA